MEGAYSRVNRRDSRPPCRGVRKAVAWFKRNWRDADERTGSSPQTEPSTVADRPTHSSVFPPGWRKRARHQFQGYPIGTVAIYRPTAHLATRIAVALISDERGVPDLLERWSSDGWSVAHTRRPAIIRRGSPVRNAHIGQTATGLRRTDSLDFAIPHRVTANAEVAQVLLRSRLATTRPEPEICPPDRPLFWRNCVARIQFILDSYQRL